jgi:2-oxoisovalerate dehydrogenase E1 component beta subunit
VFPAYDQIVSQLAKMHYRSRGTLTMPIVVRIPFGGGIGAVEHHSESPEVLFAHVAGLKVVACSNPSDAYTMMRQAVASDDPIIFLEPKRRYWEKAEIDVDVALEHATPLHAARVVRPGRHATLLAYGPAVKTALDVATVAADEGRELEVIDIRSLSPLDWEIVTESVRHTGRAIVVHEAPVFLGLGAEIAARVSEQCFYSLQAPVLRVGGFSTPYPPSRLEEHFLPDLDRVLEAVDRSLAY